MLLDEDPDTADLRAKVVQAWQEFTQALAAALAALPPGAELDVTLDPTASGTGEAVYAVTVRAEDDRLAAVAVGNASLPDAYRMNRAAVADMIALGWSPPGVEPGSGDQFGLTTTAGQAPRLAGILARTLRDIYGAPHPAFLVYLAQDSEDEPLPIPPLGIARSVASLEDTAPVRPPAAAESDTHDADLLRERVRIVLAAMQKSATDQLPIDADGDIAIRAGSAMVFVRVRDDPPLVDVFSPVLTEVKPSEKLYARLSELTNRMPVGRLYCASGTVWASVPVFGRSFQPSHLMLAVQVMTGLADELDDRLHGEFGGRRFFGEEDKPAHHGESEGTGMYL
jgi:hypothetical protein